MREIRLYGSEGGGAVCSPYPYQTFHLGLLDSDFRRNDVILRFQLAQCAPGPASPFSPLRSAKKGRSRGFFHRSKVAKLHLIPLRQLPKGLHLLSLPALVESQLCTH